MAGENWPPPLSPSASRLHGAGAGLHHFAPFLRSSSPATSIPSLEQQRSGEIWWERPAAGEVVGDPHAAEVRGEPHNSGEVHGETQQGTIRHSEEISPAATNATPTSVHDPSPAATNGSKRKSRRLTSAIWKDAEPIYIDGFLKQGRCKHCNTVFPASRVSGTSQLTRHMRVCEVKVSMAEVRGKVHKSGEVHGETQVTIRHSEEISPATGRKRTLSEASGSLRASKAAKVISAKVVTTQLQNNAKTVGSKLAPIVSTSPMLNTMARKRGQSHARSPNSAGTLKSPSLHDLSTAATNCTPTSVHDLSPAATNGTPTSVHDLSPDATNGSKRRKSRRLTSAIWKDAEPIYIDGILKQGRCKHCNVVFPASRVSGTSQISRHMKVCEVKDSMDGVIQQMKTSDEIDPDWKFDQEAARSELVKLIVLHGLPFSFVEYSGFRKFCASLNPCFKSVNRVTIQNDCIDTYHLYRSAYEDFFMNCNYRVSLTGEIWTSNQKLGYLCITCHWIDTKWRVGHRIIRFCLVETPHDAQNMFDVVLNSLRDWNIENKLFSFTMDNAEVNTKMINHLRKSLVDRNLLHHEGKLLHIRCAAHVLNLIVQDGLKAMKSVVDNVRESVKYISSSEIRKKQFASVVAQVGVMCKHQPSLDVSTRWNSTFLMLESTIPFIKVFKTLEEQEPNYAFGLSDEDWKMVEDICELLKVFYDATNIISGSNYPTSNLYFLEIWSVKLVLEKQAKSDNGTIRIMVKEMQKKFDEYFMESYLSNCIPVILDPRFKMDLVELRLKKYFGVDADKHIQEVRIAIEALFTEYATEYQDNIDFLSQEGNGEEVLLVDSSLVDWEEHVKRKKANSCNELQRYLEEDFHPRTPDFDILKWWAVNSARYPTLGNIARDVLAVPASAVASESAFSACGRVISDHSSSLAPETVEALMCFGDWIRPGGSSSEASTPDVVL